MSYAKKFLLILFCFLFSGFISPRNFQNSKERIKESIERVFIENSNRHILEVFKEVKEEISFCIKSFTLDYEEEMFKSGYIISKELEIDYDSLDEVNSLIDSIKNPLMQVVFPANLFTDPNCSPQSFTRYGVKFPRENLAYKALVEVIKSWPKKDLHCHVSPTLSSEWVVDTIKNNWAFYKKEFEKRIFSDQYKNWREKNKNTVMLEAAKAFYEEEDKKEIENIFKTYENPTDAFDIPIIFAPENNLKFVLSAIKSVIKKYFDDGVRLVELRLNPCKEFNGVRIDPFLTLKKMAEVASVQEKIYEEKYGVEHKVKFMFSFNQANYPNKKSWFVSTVKRVVDNFHDEKFSFLKRVSGVDLSGMEKDSTKRSSWSELLDAVYYGQEKDINLQLVVHAGDRWNVDQDYNLNLDKHLEFVKDTLTLKNLSRIGHGNILWPSSHAVRPDESCSTREINRYLSDVQKNKVEEIIKIIKQKNVKIMCLPKAEFDDISLMKDNPFYYWKKRGVKLGVGVDGTCYTDSGLSEWIAWLLLASPEKDCKNKSIITVAEMREIVSL